MLSNNLKSFILQCASTVPIAIIIIYCSYIGNIKGYFEFFNLNKFIDEASQSFMSTTPFKIVVKVLFSDGLPILVGIAIIILFYAYTLNYIYRNACSLYGDEGVEAKIIQFILALPMFLITFILPTLVIYLWDIHSYYEIFLILIIFFLMVIYKLISVSFSKKASEYKFLKNYTIYDTQKNNLTQNGYARVVYPSINEIINYYIDMVKQWANNHRIININVQFNPDENMSLMLYYLTTYNVKKHFRIITLAIFYLMVAALIIVYFMQNNLNILTIIFIGACALTYYFFFSIIAGIASVKCTIWLTNNGKLENVFYYKVKNQYHIIGPVESNYVYTESIVKIQTV